MKRRWICLVAVGLAVLCVAFFSSAPRIGKTLPPPKDAKAEMSDSGEWNTYHGDAALRGVADAAFPNALEIVWRLKTGAAVRQTPVVSQGRVFVATARGEIVAANLDGVRQWSHELFTGKTANGEPVRERIEAPIACFEGRVFVGTDSGVLVALDCETGAEQWRAKLDEGILGAPNYLPPIGPDVAGRVYAIEQASGNLVCFDAAFGKVLWRTEGVERSDASPSVSRGAVVFGSCAAALHVLSADTGARLRDIAIDPDSQVAGGAALVDGLAFAGCRSGKVVAANVETGALAWVNEKSESEVFATPAVNADWVIAASYDGCVYGLTRQAGELRWKFDTGASPLSPVIAGDKVVVSADGELILLSLAQGVKLFSLHVSEEITSPALTSHLVLVGCEDATLVALGAPRQ